MPPAEIGSSATDPFDARGWKLNSPHFPHASRSTATGVFRFAQGQRAGVPPCDRWLPFSVDGPLAIAGRGVPVGEHQPGTEHHRRPVGLSSASQRLRARDETQTGQAAQLPQERGVAVRGGNLPANLAILEAFRGSTDRIVWGQSGVMRLPSTSRFCYRPGLETSISKFFCHALIAIRWQSHTTKSRKQTTVVARPMPRLAKPSAAR